jgi:hypothetical protein
MEKRAMKNICVLQERKNNFLKGGGVDLSPK